MKSTQMEEVDTEKDLEVDSLLGDEKKGGKALQVRRTEKAEKVGKCETQNFT